jgi:hypothetical protein
MTKECRIPNVFCCLLLTAALATAPAVSAAEQVQQHGATTVRAELDKDAIELSGSLTLKFTVEGKAPLEIEPVKTVTASKAWLVTSLGAAETEGLPKGRMRWQQAFRLSPLQDKDVPLPLEPLQCRAGGGDTVQVMWKPFTIKVSTVVASPSLDALKPIVPPEQIPEPPAWPRWPFVLAGVLAIVVVISVVVRRRARQRAVPAAVELPPKEWALQELDRLEAQLPSDASQVERYHTLLADVVRHYLERRFGIHASEQTSAEFLNALAQSNQLPAAQQEQLRAFFERCDLAKYARADYSAEECCLAVQLARDFVNQTPQATVEAAQAVGAPTA